MVDDPTPITLQSNSPLLRRLQSNLALRHYSPRTIAAYCGWVIRFVRYHRLRHPATMGEAEVMAFLGYLREQRRVAAATQTQALAALQCLYAHVLDRPLRVAGQIPRAKGPTRLPVVLTPDEVSRVLRELAGVYAVVGLLLYGSGLRLTECVTLRVKDVDLERREIVLRRGKGGKDRVTVLPGVLVPILERHLARVRAVHERDRARGGGWVALPGALARKYPEAPVSWGWQWVFPASRAAAAGGWAGVSAPSAPDGDAAGDASGGAASGNCQAGGVSHLAAQFRDPPVAGRGGHPDDPGVVGASGRDDDDVVHPCPQSRRAGGSESVGPAGPFPCCIVGFGSERAQAKPGPGGIITS